MNEIVGAAALLVIDAQYDFLDPAGAVPCLNQPIIAAVQHLVAAARRAAVPVIFTQEVHRSTHIDFGRELDGAESIHCVDGSHGVEIVAELTPQPGDVVVRKPRYSAFLGTDLPFVLNGVGVRPGDTLILAGAATNVCVHYTAADAFQRDYRIRVVTDAVAGTSQDAHAAALQAIQYLQSDSLVSAQQMIAAFADYAPPVPSYRREALTKAHGPS